MDCYEAIATLTAQLASPEARLPERPRRDPPQLRGCLSTRRRRRCASVPERLAQRPTGGSHRARAARTPARHRGTAASGWRLRRHCAAVARDDRPLTGPGRRHRSGGQRAVGSTPIVGTTAGSLNAVTNSSVGNADSALPATASSPPHPHGKELRLGSLDPAAVRPRFELLEACEWRAWASTKRGSTRSGATALCWGAAAP